MVSDLNSGAMGSFPSNLTNLNGTLVFSADDGVQTELWGTVVQGATSVALSSSANPSRTGQKVTLTPKT